MTQRNDIRALFCALFSWSLVAACGTNGVTDDPALSDDQIDLEAAFGGLDDADEPPMFGDDAFALLEEDAEDPSAPADLVDDTVPDPGAAPDRPDTARVAVTVLWGHLRPQPDETDWTSWDGGLSATGARVVGLRTVRFEGRDRLVRPNRRGAVAWVSRTLGHHDGVQAVLQIPLPDDSARPSVQPTLNVVAGTFTATVPIRPLLDHRRIVDVGDNQVAMHAFLIRPDECPTGRLAGRWLPRNDRGIGRFFGRWTGAAGRLSGHVRGVYGVRSSGERVFFGKVINENGRFIGRLRGTYEDGEFAGRWHTRSGEAGAVAGRYTTAPFPGGVFLGRWAERCNRGQSTMPEMSPTRGR